MTDKSKETFIGDISNMSGLVILSKSNLYHPRLFPFRLHTSLVKILGGPYTITTLYVRRTVVVCHDMLRSRGYYFISTHALLTVFSVYLSTLNSLLRPCFTTTNERSRGRSTLPPFCAPLEINSPYSMK